MVRTMTRASLLSVLLLVVAAAAANSSPILAQEQQKEGVFGQVTGITTPFPGLTVITLDTVARGIRQVEAAENTVVTIPARETAAAADISIGDFLAVLANRAGERLQALRILVKPDVPVSHTHITGTVVGGTVDRVSIIDRDGNVLTADLLIEDARIDPAQVVTAVVRQDLKAGSLSFTGTESVEAKIERIGGALETASRTGARQNQENLGQRAKAAATGHLTTLQEIRNRVGPGIRVFFDQAIERSIRSYQVLGALFDLGEPTVALSGVIDEIDLTRGTLLVSPIEGSPVQLRVTQATGIRLFGVPARAGNLELGQEIESVYDFQTNEAQTIEVVFPTLPGNLIGSLLSQARAGELEGTVGQINTASDPPVVVLRLASGRAITLTITPDTRIRVRQQPGNLQDLVPLVQVKVRYDPATGEALEVETFDVQVGQAFVTGVVKSFIPKIRPGIRIPGNAEDGNISIASPDGGIITLHVTDASIIEREGLRFNIGAVRLGDLVRPTSSYNTSTREIQRLVLRAPEFRGTVRGKISTPSGREYLTVSTDELNVVTVTVPSATFAAVDVGERVGSGVYNPLRKEASQLATRPPKSLRTSGTVTALDQRFLIVTVTPAVGQPLELLVPNKPGIITKDGNPKANFSELKVGDRVQLAFYSRDNVVVRIIVKSR